MEAEAVLNLFDSYWFDLDLLQKNPSQINKFPEMAPSNPEIPPLPTIHTKTPVFELITSDSPQKLSDSSASPNSVLLTPKLQTIFSGKISEDFEDYSRSEKETPENTNITTTTTTTSKTVASPLKGNTGITNRRRKKKGLSKSLSDLEFEELKGFMDLGFVFSEEDKDSSLVSIIPGLQRLGNNNNNCNNINHNINTRNNNNSNVDEITNNKVGKSDATSSSISRPYLSEAWEVMEKKRRENSLLKWRVPDPNSQVQMKDNLRFWAHTVASTVR